LTPGPLAQANDRVVLISSDGKRFVLSLQPGMTFHSHLGQIAHDDLIGQPLGRAVLTHLDQPFIVLRPSLYDTIMNVKRVSQIIYPKEIGLILLKLDIGSGSRVIEAGSGSGALTIALAHGVAPAGRVYSYEVRDEMIKATQRNLDRAGLAEWVELYQRDIAEGFDQTQVDALFLDVREPCDYLSQVEAALVDGGFFGALLPTTNQVSDLLAALSEWPAFINLEVLEIFMRHYKPVPQRLRPSDTMIGHTGFLLFARKIASDEAVAGGFTNTMSRKRS
jgi:tRNA (adenine57-N1/adenine58-N1)-methyltransferase